MPSLALGSPLPSDEPAPSPFGQYNKTVEDLRVKVLGGHVSVTRQWRGAERRWQIQPHWETLRFVFQDGDAVPAEIWRGDHQYERGALSTGMLLWHSKDPAKVITFASGVYRWQDTKGNWVEFGEDGRALRFGDRNITVGTILRDAEGRISSLRDHLDFEVLTFEYDASANLERAADYSGREVFYGYTGGGQLASVTDVRGEPWTYTYAGGFLHTKTDPEGRTTTIEVGASGVLESVRDQDGAGADYRYNYEPSTKRFYAWIRRDGNVVEEMWFNRDDEMVRRDQNGRTVMTMRRDGTHRIFTDEHRNETRVELDVRRRLTRLVHPDGAVLRRKPGIHDVTEVLVDENGVVTRYELDANGNPTRKIEAEGLPEERVTEYSYDAYGNVTERREVVDDGAADRVWTYEYDDFGNLERETDAEGNVTVREYDPQGNVIERTDPRDEVWLSEYDAAGNLVRTEDPLGNVATYEYDKVGNLIRQTDPTGAETHFVYDGQNRLVERVDALGHVWRYEYDAAGNMARTIDPLGHATSYEYDRDGRLVRQVDAAGNVIRIEHYAGRTPANPGRGRLERMVFPTFTQEHHHDARGQLIAESKIDGEGVRATTSFRYDAASNLLAVTNSDGRTTQSAFDGLNRITQRTFTDGRTVTISRDRWDEEVQVTDPRQQTTVLRFDKLGQRISETRPRGGVLQFAYDASGNLAAIVDARGQRVEWGYDGAGRRQQEKTFPSAEAETPSKTVAYTQSARGELVAWSDGEMSGSFVFDAVGQVVAQAVDYGPFSAGSEHSYYANGLPKTYTGPDQVTYTYGYDADRKLRTVNIPGEGMITYNAYRWVAVEKVTLPGGSVQEFEYDDLLQMTRARSADPAGNVIQDQRYERDVTGRVIAKVTDEGSNAYGYDAAYQLTSVTSDVMPNEAYAYDAVGNRLPADPELQDDWSYNQDNELIATDTTTYEYDAAGNRTWEVGPDAVRRYFWDEHSRLVRVEDGDESPIAAYGYDPFARRLSKDVDGERTYFAYSKEGLVAEFDAAGAVTRSYGYEPGSEWTTAPLLLRTGDGVHYYHNDQRGAPERLTDANGATVWSAWRTAYGEVDTIVQAAANPIGFPGQYRDSETALHQNWHRYYDASTGRYLTADPLIRYGAPNTSSLEPYLISGLWNSYSYAFQDPLSWIDPTGQFAEHTRNSRPSTAGRHERGRARVRADQGSEEADSRRRPHRKKPDGWRGKWPPPPKGCLLMFVITESLICEAQIQSGRNVRSPCMRYCPPNRCI